MLDRQYDEMIIPVADDKIFGKGGQELLAKFVQKGVPSLVAKALIVAVHADDIEH